MPLAATQSNTNLKMQQVNTEQSGAWHLGGHIELSAVVDASDGGGREARV